VTDEHRQLFKIIAPAAWPVAPLTMSYSTLKQLEMCPRQWGLRHAKYPGLWSGAGYPGRVIAAQLRGTVIHGAIEAIVAEARKHNTASGGYSLVLRELGGLTAVLRRQIGRQYEVLKANPRAMRQLPILKDAVRRNLQEWRSSLQDMVGRLPVSLPPKVRSREDPAGVTQRTGLRPGVHVEVALEDQLGRWRGIVDLLRASPDGCEIVDMKLGARQPDHDLQVRLYAVLWASDHHRNPGQWPVTKLTVRYTDVDHDVPVPTHEEAQRLAQSLEARCEAINRDIAQPPPPARLGDHCLHCDVRHLCNDYWETQGLSSFARGSGKRVDVQLRITESPKGPTARATGRRAGWETNEKEVMIRWSARNQAQWCDLATGESIRVLGALWQDDLDEIASTPIVVIGDTTEVFSV